MVQMTFYFVDRELMCLNNLVTYAYNIQAVIFKIYSMRSSIK